MDDELKKYSSKRRIKAFKATDMFFEWLREHDLLKTFRDTGTFIYWAQLDKNDKYIVHMVQPNRLNFLGWFDTEEKTLKTVQKDLSNEDYFKILKDNHGIEETVILDYDKVFQDSKYPDDSDE